MHSQIRSCKLDLTILNVISGESIDHHVHVPSSSDETRVDGSTCLNTICFSRIPAVFATSLRHGNIETRILSPMHENPTRLVRGHANRNGRPLPRDHWSLRNGSAARARAQYGRSGAYQRRDIS